MRRKVWLLVIILIALLLGVNNTIYYVTTKHSLEVSLQHELETAAKQIGVSIEVSRRGSEKYQEEIGRELRAASIASQYALNPDVEKVTNSQLEELAKKLELVDITLLKRTTDSIVLYKSSDPKERSGYRTNSWNPWYTAFNQLFDDKQVTVNWGQSLTNFWTGPFEFSSTTTDKIHKWGYYYDGSTNYLIDPYISYASRQLDYDQSTGVTRLINETLAENQSLQEITIINPATFEDGEHLTITENGEQLSHMTQSPISYGSYTFKHAHDGKNVKLAVSTNEKVYQDAVINGKHVIKLFLPVDVSDTAKSMLDGEGQPIQRYVLSVVADYSTVQQALDMQFRNIAFIMTGVTVLSLIFLYWVVTSYRKSQDKLVRKAQETYLDEINGLFQSIRAQRHDFMNHVQTIHSLAELGKTEELKAYASELTGEIRQMNDIINIGDPAIAALIRSKMLQAEVLKVDFTCEFSEINRLELGIKSLDMTRLLGNLIDNAFDEVMTHEEGDRRVHIAASHKAGYFQFSISNTCFRIEELKGKPLFKAGYSSKNNSHSGLGLHIVKSIVDKYKGFISLDIHTADKIAFIIKIPF
ncbi:sensor histidine kinase [Paenibacillus sp. R14(2021)]|uniref:sensor histidine kinase n=1 Tax=Paenibacillus sp. R14(2021) TaxID=2859228 RepID=UPI001C614CFD|nr:GHKL domain-containing protein [Paenibacillus sp. R14(2021)]